MAEGEPRGTVLQVRIKASGAAFIDSNRGKWSRSEYVRRALQIAAAQGLRGPGVDG